MNATKNHILKLESLLMFSIVVYFQKNLQLRSSDYRQLLNTVTASLMDAASNQKILFWGPDYYIKY